ncbi:type II secretion system protein [Candidatus Saccharibacteria bacterium TM7i]|nr:type II secretion system protein [Candidatus Saccharibacteria bacterium TM7i]
MNTTQTKKGFTIIEVVLVLAIAGLIFLMVFIALPALQSGQRDNARKNDVSIVASAVNSFTSANRGADPVANKAKVLTFIENVSDNTDEAKIDIVSRPTSNTIAVGDSEVKVVVGAKCGTTGAKGTGGTATQNLTQGTKRQYATVTLLEGGKGSSFCQDS